MKKNPAILPFLLIAAGCFLIYGRILGFGFVWDDFGLIVKTDALRDWENFGKFFTTPYWLLATGEFTPLHRPLAPVLILLISSFSGTEPWGYHFISLLLFTAISIVFYLYLKHRNISRTAVFTAVTLWILHPVHVEAVSWVSCQPLLLSGLCFILLLLISSKLNPENALGLLPTAAVFYTLGLMSYHSILGLPFLIFFQDLLTAPSSRKPWKLRLIEYGLYIILTAGFIFYTQAVIFHHTGLKEIRPFYAEAGANMVYTAHPAEWFLAPLNTFSRYAGLLLLPFQIMPDAYFKTSELSLSALAALCALILITVFSNRRDGNKNTLLFPGLWMLLGLLTVSNFTHQGGLFADRYAFIASMGFCLWAGLSAENLYLRFPGLHKIFFAAGISFLLILGIQTFRQTRVWENDFAFWFYASQSAPQKARNHYHLGGWWEKTGRLKEAAESYQRAFELDPENFGAARERLRALSYPNSSSTK